MENPSDITIPQSLDGWYLLINSVYLDRNFYRDSSSIFDHFVEIVGGLSLLATNKTKPNVTPDRYIPKAIAWWMALCGKLGVRSVEDLVWRKFPSVCTYCHFPVHQRKPCRDKKLKSGKPDWPALTEYAKENAGDRPQTLDAWREMFSKMYPLEQYPIAFARFGEEVGEMAEALRVFRIAPGYFLSEAADLFAWLMNLYSAVADERDQKHEEMPSLQNCFERMYPGLCGDCGHRRCICPPILPSSLGRIAKEVPLLSNPFAPGGALLSADDALAIFSIGTKTVRFGEATINADADILRGIQLLILQIREEMQKSTELTQLITGSVQQSLERIEENAGAYRLTQEQIDELFGILRAMPSPALSMVFNILGNLASAPWAALFLEQLKR